MQLVSGEAGWALDANALLLSRDGGGSWQPITPAGVNAAEIDTAFFLNLGVGWIVSQPPPGSEIEFYRTKNTGTSWQRLSVIPVQAGVARATHLVFVDEQHGWLVVDQGSHGGSSSAILFRSVDGGMTWRQSVMPHSAPVVFMTALDGFSAGGPTARGTFVTHDGGQSWSPLPKPSVPSAYATSWFDLPLFRTATDGVLPATFGYASGSPLAIGAYTTTDGGRSWSYGGSVATQSDNRYVFPLGVADPDDWIALVPQTASGSPPGRAIMVTHDRGRSWTRLNATVLPVGVEALSFSSPQFGWALVSESGCQSYKSECLTNAGLVSTRDGGVTWSQIL